MVILKEMDKIAETTKKDIQSSDFSNMFLDPNKWSVMMRYRSSSGTIHQLLGQGHQHILCISAG